MPFLNVAGLFAIEIVVAFITMKNKITKMHEYKNRTCIIMHNKIYTSKDWQNWGYYQYKYMLACHKLVKNQLVRDKCAG